MRYFRISFTQFHMYIYKFKIKKITVYIKKGI